MTDNIASIDNIYVSFSIGTETYGIGIDDVRQIIRVPKITRVPKMPEYVLGMTNLRGEVLPLVDLSLRMGYGEVCEHSEDTRVIVVDKLGVLTGLIVESVNEVKSTEVQDIDKFPEILNASVDKRYISGIMKVGSGEDVSIIQIINTDEVIDLDAAVKKMEQNGTLVKADKGAEESHGGVIDERRFISFNVHAQEYAIEIHKINEIIWMPDVTSVPGLPKYVLGIFSLRGQVIPLLSLHEKFGMELKTCKETTRVVIVDIENVMVAFAADRVNAVLSVDESLIELPPKIYEEDDSEVCAVLKLENGQRLVMVLEPEHLVDEAELEALKQVSQQTTEMKQMSGHEDIHADEERQIVTFQLESENYGIDIQKVQEINRYTNVTRIPKTPKFVEGIINLRGEVIPLIDLRSRFELEPKERDEFTRVIIVNLLSMKVGFVVDWVDEVLRIRQDDIDNVPPMLSAAVNSEFIDGVVNFEKKERMILLLDVEELFSKAEIKKLENLQEG